MATAIALRIRVNNTTTSIHNHRFLQLFSSSSSSSPPFSKPNVEDEDTSHSPSSNSSMPKFLSDVKAKLQQPQTQTQQQREPHSPLTSRISTDKAASLPNLQTIRQSLAQYRDRSAAAPPRRDNPSSPDVSLEEIFKRNVIPQGGEPSNNLSSGNHFNFKEISERLRQKKLTTTGSGGMLSGGGFRIQPNDTNQSQPMKFVIDKKNVPASFYKDVNRKSADQSSKKTMTRFYRKEELGKMLSELRPEEVKGSDKSFSLQELNDRLIKLRETDLNKPSFLGGFGELRESIQILSQEEEEKKSFMTRLPVISQIGGTPRYMLSPPKEHLVEKYFHPDNMSSAEKMKLELQRVRDEFKMSESDCGSSRVQVAILTTKIKHLSTALHKKDKHSRKGLQAMVQKRKKLLKYMRRTDWDSYCLVLSKLGLRDNPDYKN